MQLRENTASTFTEEMSVDFIPEDGGNFSAKLVNFDQALSTVQP
jgi:hypothetical protein